MIVRGKGSRQDELPLPVDVGEAIVSYLSIAAREEEERDAVILADPGRRQLKPAVPSEIENQADLQRWHLAVAVARHRAPAARAEELWDIARDLWATAGADALRGEQASIPPPRDTRGEQFRRRPRRVL